MRRSSHTGRRVRTDWPQSPLQQAGRVGPVLDRQRPVRAEFAGQRLDLGLRRLRTGGELDGIARQQVRDGEDEQRQPDKHGDEQDEAADRVEDHRPTACKVRTMRMSWPLSCIRQAVAPECDRLRSASGADVMPTTQPGGSPGMAVSIDATCLTPHFSESGRNSMALLATGVKTKPVTSARMASLRFSSTPKISGASSTTCFWKST